MSRALWVLLWRAGGWHVPAVLALAVLQGLAPTAAILATGVLLDGRSAWLGLGLLATALLAGAVLSAITDIAVQNLNGRYGRAVHQTVARATLGTRGVAELEDPLIAGEVAALAEFERDDGFVGTVSYLRELLQRRATGVSAFVVLLSFAWWAPLVLLVGWRALSHAIGRWLETGAELGAEQGATRMRRSRYLWGLAVGVGPAKEVRLFGLADWLVRGFADTYRSALEAIWAGRRLGLRTMLGATATILVAHAVVFGTMGWQAWAGTLSVPALAVFAQAVAATSALGHVFGAELPLANARQVAFLVLRLEQRLAQPETRSAQSNGPADVLLHNVRFTYPGRFEPTLDGLHLTVPKGQSLAIVGENGVGKSTLVKLLCGLYEPDAGHVQVVPRHKVAAIFQTFVRYELPLRDNVAFGNRALPDEELKAALADAGGQDLLGHWDTVLAAGEHDLSGGQWQKVALARALAAVRGGAELLILDEPTASLDVRAEAELFDRFLATTEGVTTILVSHRLASVRRCDRIVVIADGRVAEDGSHDQLMAAGGRYARMFAAQAERFAVVS